jgi:hypothetical protein
VFPLQCYRSYQEWFAHRKPYRTVLRVLIIEGKAMDGSCRMKSNAVVRAAQCDHEHDNLISEEIRTPARLTGAGHGYI